MKTNAGAPVDLDETTLDTVSAGRRPPAETMPLDSSDAEHVLTPEQAGIIVWGART
ncbi:MAG: hypothetical protein AAF479_02285 [Pseudomonadota bacterium]